MLGLASQKAEEMLKQDRISTFTFNDTIVFALTAEKTEPTIVEASAFFRLLRKFMIDSLQNGILFRGAIAMGSFYAHQETNTIMGEAVTDAAAWYAEADWVGIYATPRSTIRLNGLLEQEQKKREQVMVDFHVPMKDGSSKQLKVVNWPKALFVPELVSERERRVPRSTVLSWFARRPVPRGAEGKCFNAIAFFEHVVETQGLIKPRKKS